MEAQDASGRRRRKRRWLEQSSGGELEHELNAPCDEERVLGTVHTSARAG